MFFLDALIKNRALPPGHLPRQVRLQRVIFDRGRLPRGLEPPGLNLAGHTLEFGTILESHKRPGVSRPKYVGYAALLMEYRQHWLISHDVSADFGRRVSLII